MLFSFVMIVADAIVQLFVLRNVPSININFGEYLMADIGQSLIITIDIHAFVSSMSYLTIVLQLENAIDNWTHQYQTVSP